MLFLKKLINLTNKEKIQFFKSLYKLPYEYLPVKLACLRIFIAFIGMAYLNSSGYNELITLFFGLILFSIIMISVFNFLEKESRIRIQSENITISSFFIPYFLMNKDQFEFYIKIKELFYSNKIIFEYQYNSESLSIFHESVNGQLISQSFIYETDAPNGKMKRCKNVYPRQYNRESFQSDVDHKMVRMELDTPKVLIQQNKHHPNYVVLKMTYFSLHQEYKEKEIQVLNGILDEELIKHNPAKEILKKLSAKV